MQQVKGDIMFNICLGILYILIGIVCGGYCVYSGLSILGFISW